ncbi:MAG TPA: hypothetical protein VFO76_09000 [Candidatus Kapabacteria bacterium]|nr:hypothetical protein [Candidatus Kapabacteria bacterium]
MITEQYQWEVKEEVLEELFHLTFQLLPNGFGNRRPIDGAVSEDVILDFRESESWEVIDPHIHLPIY